MIYPIYSVRDSLTGFKTITIGDNDAESMRGFAHACYSQDSLMNSHPNDYTLYRIGELNTDTGEIEPCVPEHICSATDFVRKDK